MGGPGDAPTRDVLHSEDVDGVRILTIDRPASKNALNAELRRTLRAALRAADRDDAVGAVVLSAVDPVFSAGVDYKEIGATPGGAGKDDAAGPTDNPAAVLRQMRTPVICAVNGACVSGALEVALSATFIVASERARFADTHALLGVVPTWGLTALLPRAVGHRKAREMSITGAFMSAEEALRFGLVNHVVEHDALLPFALKLAAMVAPTAAVGDMLELYRRGEELSPASALAAEAAFSATRTYDRASFASAGSAASARQRSGGT